MSRRPAAFQNRLATLRNRLQTLPAGSPGSRFRNGPRKQASKAAHGLPRGFNLPIPCNCCIFTSFFSGSHRF